MRGFCSSIVAGRHEYDPLLARARGSQTPDHTQTTANTTAVVFHVAEPIISFRIAGGQRHAGRCFGTRPHHRRLLVDHVTVTTKGFQAILENRMVHENAKRSTLGVP